MYQTGTKSNHVLHAYTYLSSCAEFAQHFRQIGGSVTGRLQPAHRLFRCRELSSASDQDNMLAYRGR